MTPEEKANELFAKYKNLVWGNTRYTRQQRAKQCAIICVDEILKQTEIIDRIYNSSVWKAIDREEGKDNSVTPFWNEVKHHLTQ